LIKTHRGFLRNSRSASLRDEEAIEDALDTVEMALFDVLANLKAISEHGRTSSSHRAELPAHIRQVLHLRGLPRLREEHVTYCVLSLTLWTPSDGDRLASVDRDGDVRQLADQIGRGR
jgi:hypothetical protein